MGRDKKPPVDPNATMAVTPSMVLPLGPKPPPKDANATMMITAEMVVNDASIVMGRGQIERALAVVALWHKAILDRDVETLVAMCTEDVEIIDPRGRGRGRAALRAWAQRSGFLAIPQRWFCGGEGHVVVEQTARWRDRHGDVTAVIASAYVVRDGKIRCHEQFQELQTALTMYGLREVHEVKRK